MFLVLIFAVYPLADGLNTRFIIWNVGQGEWTTLVTGSTCFHFDMGGEFDPVLRVQLACSERKNKVYYSHWDWDHIGFTRTVYQKLRSLCIAALPGGKGSKYKISILQKLPVCEDPPSTSIRELTATGNIEKMSNDSSRVFIAVNQVIISGDSPTSKEKAWSLNIPQKLNSPILVLGHHGSRTSTSENLLNHFYRIRIAIASARKKRYGHPHLETLIRLKIHKVPTITTESWGTILLEL